MILMTHNFELIFHFSAFSDRSGNFMLQCAAGVAVAMAENDCLLNKDESD